MENFGTLLKQARRSSKDPQTGRPLTQERLAELLEEGTGLNYQHASVSNWEREVNKIHHNDRAVLVGLIKLFQQGGGLPTVEEANHLLVAGDYRRLNEAELRTVNPEWKMPTMQTMLPTPAAQAAALPAIQSPFVDVGDVVDRWVSQLGVETFLAGLMGVAGSGKSVLAVAVAHRLIVLAKFKRVLRLLVGSAEEVTGKLAHEIFGNAELADPAREVGDYLRQQAYFVVIDGLESVPDTLWEQLAAWAQPSCFLVTGRIRPNSPTIRIYEPPIWDNNTIFNYVRELTQRRDVQIADDLLRTLCALIGSNPQALQLIPMLALRRSAEQLSSALQYSSHLQQLLNEITANAWTMLDEDARALLTTLSFVTEAGASAELLQTVSRLEPRRFWGTLERLEQYLFVGSHAERVGWFHVHRLVAHYVLAQNGERVVQIGAAILGYWQQRFERLSKGDWHMLSADQPNIFYTVQVCLTLQDDPVRLQLSTLLPILHRFAEHWGYTAALEPLLAQSLTLPHPPDAQCQLTILLGATQRRNAKWQAALETLQTGIRLAQALGDEALLAQAQWELASVLKGVGEVESAEIEVKQALNLYQQQADERGVGLSKNMLGLIAYEREDWEVALQFLREAILLLETTNLANTYLNLAATLSRLKQYEEALAAYGQARTLYEQHGSELNVLRVASSEASLYAEMGQLDEAERLFALIDVTKIPRLRTQAFYWSNWGRVAKDRKQWDIARTRLQKGAEMWEAVADQRRVEQIRAEIAQIDAL